ncbi:MAG TPA: S9 family peptidase [Actinomycetota bacterium]|nr:S9 family peptidase [Actinomycetota bacterium]
MAVTVPGVRPYGTWPSPITAVHIAEAGVHLSQPWVEGDVVSWLELRPNEGGRTVLCRADPWGSTADVTPSGFDVRDKVHEYGGAPYALHDGTVVFANFEDQRLYRQEPGSSPQPITTAPPGLGVHRYADMRVSPDGRLAACVRERHAASGVPVNELAMVLLDGSAEPWVVASGRDFYAAPRFSPDGARLVWLEWDMPRMPWDGTELMLADVADGRLGPRRLVAGGPAESVFQPEWSPDGVLHFVSDRTGWWNLYRQEADGTHRNLTPLEAEFGVPLWEFGYATYAFLSEGRIACVYRRDGVHHLAMLDPTTSELLDLDLPYSCFDPPYLDADGTRIAFVGSSPTEPPQVVTLDFATRAVDVLRISQEIGVDADYLSVPEPIAFPTEGGLAYAYHYPPTNPDVAAPPGELPPLIVKSHGGPTGEAVPELDLEIQYFTSRGFAVVDVNYGGSTGYGRPYRERLYGRWGIVDVADCISAARFLCEQGKADPDRLVVTGGSAGGYTTLCALTFHDVFACGASYFGVADLEPFATSTHKFELKYTDLLVGPYPEAAELWHERSPVRHADQLTRPVLLLQGLEDEVVPPSQAEIMVQALEAKRIPYAYLTFEGEQHGFRKAETIVRAIEAELTFYGRILGFEPADDLPPLQIHHLPA